MATIITHSGKFHADDVFAVAALLLHLGDGEIIRTRDPNIIESGDYVVDVGGVFDAKRNRFDHHQVGGAGNRPHGIPYAAFGLVWSAYGASIAKNAETAERVDDILVAPVDANDNGVDLMLPKHEHVLPYDLPDVIRAYIPTWQEGNAGQDQAFFEAVSFAKRIIEREIRRAEAVVASREKVAVAYREADDKRLIVLDEDYSWKDTISAFPEPLYVVHPQNGTWRVFCVRDNPYLFANRKDLPESWAGLRDAELAKVTGVADAVFVHRNRFMAVTKTKEGAVALAKLALNA